MVSRVRKIIGGISVAVFLVILLLIFMWIKTGMVRTVNKDVSSDTQYSWIIGKRYQTRTDLVIFKYSDSEGLYLTEFGHTVPTREEMRTEFPYKDESGYGRIIYGILSEGSQFTVTKVKEHGPSTGTLIHYYAIIDSSSKREWEGKEMGVGLLTDLSEVPEFEQTLLREVESKETTGD